MIVVSVFKHNISGLAAFKLLGAFIVMRFNPTNFLSYNFTLF